MMNKVAIIVGGTSFNDIDKKKVEEGFDDIIVVNKSLLDFPNAKYFVTMDYTFLTKIEKEVIDQFTGTKVFIANLYYQYMVDENGIITDTRTNLIYDLSGFDMIIKSNCQTPFSMTFKDFSNGNNSGYSAIQLAISLRYDDIYLFGFDLNCTNKTHYHSGYSQDIKEFEDKLDEYYKLFHQSISELQTIHLHSCSNISRLNKILTRNRDFDK